MQEVINLTHKKYRKFIEKHNAKVPIVRQHAFDRALERFKMDKPMFRTICEQAYGYGKRPNDMPQGVRIALDKYRRKNRNVYYFPISYGTYIFLCKYHYLTGLTCINTVFLANQWYRGYLK